MTPAEERAILCRVAYDAWSREPNRVRPYRLPQLFAPVPRAHALEMLKAPPGQESVVGLKQAVASFYVHGDDGGASDDIQAVLGDKAAAPREGPCPCCNLARRIEGGDRFWELNHRYGTGTLTQFDSVSQSTKITSTYLISGPSGRTPTAEQVDRLFAGLADQFDPANWSRNAPASFSQSKKIPFEPPPRWEADTPNEAPWEPTSGWTGHLLENFHWSWNPTVTSTMQNILNVQYRLGQRKIALKYSLSESLSSDLWLAPQTGGLDIDRGACTVEDHGFNELPPDHEKALNVIPFPSRDQLRRSGFKESARYNIGIRASKELRFTPIAEGPDWLSTLINYMTPVIAGMWMSRAVQTGALNAIRDAGGTSTDGEEGVHDEPVNLQMVS